MAGMGRKVALEGMLAFRGNVVERVTEQGGMNGVPLECRRRGCKQETLCRERVWKERVREKEGRREGKAVVINEPEGSRVRVRVRERERE